jgi:hypothetical protein
MSKKQKAATPAIVRAQQDAEFFGLVGGMDSNEKMFFAGLIGLWASRGPKHVCALLDRMRDSMATAKPFKSQTRREIARASSAQAGAR